MIPGLISLSAHWPALYVVALAVRSLFGYLHLRNWRRRLNLQRFRGLVRPTHPMQVTGPDGRPGEHLVGVIVEGQAFTLVHTRPLSEHDVVHELLHVLKPHWSHEEVELWTELLVAEPRLAPLLVGEDRREAGIDEATAAGVAIRLASKFGNRIALTKGVFMKDLTAFNLRTKKRCNILKPELVTLKNGRKAVRGVASDDGATTVVRILSPEAAKEWEMQSGGRS
jgi:hypothetical protein